MSSKNSRIIGKCGAEKRRIYTMCTPLAAATVFAAIITAAAEENAQKDDDPAVIAVTESVSAHQVFLPSQLSLS